MKQCSKCGHIKYESEFHKNKCQKNGLRSDCKKCGSLRDRSRYAKNVELINANCKKWANKNKERVKENHKNFRQKNRNRVNEYNANWRKNNPDHTLEYHREYRFINKAKIRVQQKVRRDSDIQYRLGINLRGRLYKALKRGQKGGSAIRDLGCSVEYLVNYLELKFLPGMTWENYGSGMKKWSIDHIVALSTVDLQNIEEFLRVCHHTNLRPLWNKDQLTTYYREQKKRPETRQK